MFVILMEHFVKNIQTVWFDCLGSVCVCHVWFISMCNFFFSLTNKVKRVHSRAAYGSTELDANHQ